MRSIINLTPYRELKNGELSIYDNIDKNKVIPDKVILYLRLGNAHIMSPGMYKHPFKSDTTLLGPYIYTDGAYRWDRDTWKYVVKYGLILPDDFIEYVMSEKGTEFIERQIKSRNSWENTIEEMKKSPNGICLLSDDAGEMSLDDF